MIREDAIVSLKIVELIFSLSVLFVDELIDPRKLSVLSLDNIKGFRLPWNTSHDSPSTTNSSFDMTTVSIQDSSNSEVRSQLEYRFKLNTGYKSKKRTHML